MQLVVQGTERRGFLAFGRPAQRSSPSSLRVTFEFSCLQTSSEDLVTETEEEFVKQVPGGPR